MTYARGGHPYPILIRPKQQPQQLEIRGSLLGVFEQADYMQGTIKLERGDKLLLYSDGAELFIGSFDGVAGFNFTEEFRRIKDLPVVEMMEQFNTLAQTQKLTPSEVDDITMVGLEIL
jgi:sigma-B regulation protein RsbU (phosphoserine phosphatase)